MWWWTWAQNFCRSSTRTLSLQEATLPTTDRSRSSCLGQHSQLICIIQGHRDTGTQLCTGTQGHRDSLKGNHTCSPPPPLGVASSSPPPWRSSPGTSACPGGLPSSPPTGRPLQGFLVGRGKKNTFKHTCDLIGCTLSPVADHRAKQLLVPGPHRLHPHLHLLCVR